jgi:hypothetical protein
MAEDRDYAEVFQEKYLPDTPPGSKVAAVERKELLPGEKIDCDVCGGNHLILAWMIIEGVRRPVVRCPRATAARV